MASASKVSAWVTALQARLQTVVTGANYWYTPRVVRAPYFDDEEHLDSTLDEQTVYFLVPEGDTPHLQTFGTMGATPRVSLLLARRYERGDDPYHPEADGVDRLEEQDRIRQDATRAIEGDPKMGGTCIDCQITAVETSAHDVWAEKWAVVFMSVQAQIEYAQGQP